MIDANVLERLIFASGKQLNSERTLLGVLPQDPK